MILTPTLKEGEVSSMGVRIQGEITPTRIQEKTNDPTRIQGELSVPDRTQVCISRRQHCKRRQHSPLLMSRSERSGDGHLVSTVFISGLFVF